MSNPYADGANALNRADVPAVSISPAAGTTTSHIATSGNTQVKAGAGVFLGISVNAPQSGAQAIAYDGTDNTGRVLGTYPLTAAGPVGVPLGGIPFSVGLFVVTSGGTPADITVLYS